MRFLAIVLDTISEQEFKALLSSLLKVGRDRFRLRTVLEHYNEEEEKKKEEQQQQQPGGQRKWQLPVTETNNEEGKSRND